MARWTACWALWLVAVLVCPAGAQDKAKGKAKAKQAPAGPPPIKVLIVTGGCCHDYPNQVHLLSEGLKARLNVQVDFALQGGTATNSAINLYRTADWAAGYDLVLHNECFADVKDAAFVETILKPHRDGLPAVNLHCAHHCYRVDFEKYREWFNFTGLDTRGHGPKKPIAIAFTDSNHPITRGLSGWTTGDEELYNNIALIPTAHELARGRQESKPGQIDDARIAWTNVFGPGKTRVFGTTLAHTNETTGDARFLDLVARGLLWAVDKLNDDGTPKPGYGKK